MKLGEKLYTYDYFDNIIEIEYKELYSTIIVRDENGIVPQKKEYYKRVFDYNSNHVLTKEIQYNVDGIIDYSIDFDSNGNEIARGGSTVFRYEYDSVGNWITKTTIDASIERPLFITKREIHYY